MRILIADDDDVLRLRLETMLHKWGHEVVTACDGVEALARLQADDPPPLAILDWLMNELDGIEVCRRARAHEPTRGMYLILLTSRSSKPHVVEGLAAGANDYVIKPFDPDELHARINVGVQVIELQRELAQRVAQLEDALTRVTQLHGLLPMCSYCKSIRDDQDYWHRVETYISEHADVQFSHGVCPECYEKILMPEVRRVLDENENGDQSTSDSRDSP